MRLIGFAVVLAVSLTLAPLAVEGQQAGKVYRVGVLGIKASDPAETRYWQAFRLGLRERGWIEGENIVLEYRWTEGNSARLPELVADLVRLKVDLILARSSIFVQPAKEATSSIPIVFATHADPVSLGHVASLSRPGGNITGLAILFPEINVSSAPSITRGATATASTRPPATRACFRRRHRASGVTDISTVQCSWRQSRLPRSHSLRSQTSHEPSPPGAGR